MVNFVHKFFDRIFALIGALSLSQLPVFIQHYIQQLSGHVAELQFQIALMTEAAESTGKTLTQFIQKFKESSDVDYSLQGNIMNEMIQRYMSLSESYLALTQSNVLDRPFIFAKYFDWSMAKATFENYHVGLTFTTEGLIYGLVGIYLGVICYFLFSRCMIFACKPLFKGKNKPPANPT